MPRSFGEVPFTLVDLQIASYNILTGVYGTSRSLDEIQTLEFTPVADTDSIKAYGRLKHLLSVQTHVEFKLSQAGIDFEALAIVGGMTNLSSGATPNQKGELTASFDGSSLPYFGLVGKVQAEGVSDLHIGMPVCMLDVLPGLKFEQNKFVMAEVAGKCIARESDNKAIFLFRHETPASISFATIFA